jgi:multiple sugar transport system ATP-binding protein
VKDPPVLRLADLSKTYANGAVGLRPTTLSLEAGGRLALLGPSGSGKSTLLRLVAGLETPTGGNVHWGDVRIDRLPPHRRGLALLAQRPTLYPQLTVLQQLPASPRRAEALALLRLETLTDRLPATLSGGERQRVALAKLLCSDAKLWLLDEPFAALDPVTRSEFRHDLHLLAELAGATIVLVTHDPADAFALGRCVGTLGDGSLRQLGTPEELRRRPGDRFTALALGGMSLVDGVVCGGESAGRTFRSACGHLEVPLPPQVEGVGEADGWPASLTLGLRPEDLRPVRPDEQLHSDEVAFRGWTAVFTEPFGRGWLVTAARGRTRFRGTWPPADTRTGSGGSPPGVGALTDWAIPVSRCEWFPAV